MGLFSLADRAVQAHADNLAPTRAFSAEEAALIPNHEEHPERQLAESEPPAAVSDALKRLVDLMPLETITLFWLAVPASESLAAWLYGTKPALPTPIDWAMYVFLLVLTPVLLLLVYLSELASKKLPRPPLKQWPWWKAIASVIAFGTWAFAVPGNPFVLDPTLLMVVWFGATLISTLLGLIDPIVEQWFSPKQA
jgi:hypothetical protein